jgi:spore coat protein U-like protein
VAAASMLVAISPASAQSLVVGALVLSKSNCKFDTTNLLLDFGTINPGATATALASVGGSVTCNGGQARQVTLGFTLGNGSNPDATGRRMRHTTVPTEFLSYGLSISPASATIDKNTSLNFTVNGTILASQYQNVMAGSYLDKVTITVAP